MNSFYEHHKDSIRFGYRCFDRILLNGLIQPFQQAERARSGAAMATVAASAAASNVLFTSRTRIRA